MLELFKTRLSAAICSRTIPTFAQFHIYGQIRLDDYDAQHADLHTERFPNAVKDGQPSHAAVEGEGRIVTY